MEIQQAVMHHKRGLTIQFLHRTKEVLFSFSMIPFLNVVMRNGHILVK
jgi:hypothetical protein